MTVRNLRERSSIAWTLAVQQHGVISRAQLLELGFTSHAIAHRLEKGRLHRIHPGVYAVGRASVTQRGRWMAAVLHCGGGAALSHGSAGALWGIALAGRGQIEVTVPGHRHPHPAGVEVHRALGVPAEDISNCQKIPVTSPVRTLIDLATCLTPARLEAAVNAADMLDLVDPEQLRNAIERRPGRRGVPALRKLLDRRTFALTDSELERRFLRLAREAGLHRPETGVRLNGFKVDFHWPDLGLVVETDGLRYHRTASQQTRDRRRDQAHAAAGLMALRFTHAQVALEPDSVTRTLISVARRLSATGGGRR